MAFDFNKIEVPNATKETLKQGRTTGAIYNILDVDSHNAASMVENTEMFNDIIKSKIILEPIDDIVQKACPCESADFISLEDVRGNLINRTATPEFHAKRGYLDTRMNSRVDLLLLDKIIPGFDYHKFVMTDNGIRVYPLENSDTVVVTLPIGVWEANSESLNGYKDNQELKVLLFVDETPSTTIGGYRYRNEYVVFRGLYTKDFSGQLTFDNPVYHLINA